MRRLRDEAGFENVTFEQGYIEDLPFEEESFNIVISNGVINLSAEKDRVFEEVSCVLRPDGRLALSDIINETRMLDSIKSNADLWAACIGGAEQVDEYTAMIEVPGFEVAEVRENPSTSSRRTRRKTPARSTASRASRSARTSAEPRCMPTYVLLTTFTQQGIEHVQDSPARTEEAKALVESLDGTWKDFFVTMGRYDGPIIADFPDDETAARAALKLAESGNVTTETLRAFTLDEFREIVGAME